jgi:hypothetical protein
VRCRQMPTIQRQHGVYDQPFNVVSSFLWDRYLVRAVPRCLPALLFGVAKSFYCFSCQSATAHVVCADLHPRGAPGSQMGTRG